MTAAELQSACEGATFCGGLALWRPTVSFCVPSSEMPNIAIVGIHFRLPDRNDSSQLLDLQLDEPISLAEDLRTAEQVVRGLVEKAVTHEVLESMLFAGVRPFDPHGPGPREAVVEMRFQANG